MQRPTALAAILLATIACGRTSPTEPQRLPDLVGAWDGSFDVAPYGEDWSHVRLVLTTTGDAITGSLLPARGTPHTITGERVEVGANLQVDIPPTHNPCILALHVAKNTRAGIEGEISGRCPYTLRKSFRLTRV